MGVKKNVLWGLKIYHSVFIDRLREEHFIAGVEMKCVLDAKYKINFKVTLISW